jgi:hypothetical protein
MHVRTVFLQRLLDDLRNPLFFPRPRPRRRVSATQDAAKRDPNRAP